MDLSSYDQTTLAGWWCDLNSFNWPPDFPLPEPPGWRDLTDKAKHRHVDGRIAWHAVNDAVDHGLAHAEWQRRQAPVLAAIRDRLARRGIDAHTSEGLCC